ncbi:neutral zinc metallopeptidase [Klebsiella sp. BIGb0407]|uniref:neutral zinc metallopeptidase n=1 Tax=Klebsiella sp. BIGb0407 TaxID=2940603 RepID=UPI00216840F9|nr:neutral zinc metallopeptidase [Klebsiella sp. BIGb0407]MCS3431857.1 putative metalloprotease [Klebsiella sp. BIGb0407]
MRKLGQPENSHPEQELRTPGQPAMRTGRGIFRIPRGKGFFILLVIVILVSYYQSAIIGLFANKKVVEKPAISYDKVVSPAGEDAEFTGMIMTTLDETWQALFERRGLKYQSPELVTYRDTVSNACGDKRQAIGTFYCPQDDTIYVSLTLYDDMQSALGAGGDFTQGYMMAHAVGHHVQKLLEPGVSATASGLSTEQELQADCFAGLWGHRMAEQQILSAGDIQPAMNVSQAIDEQQRQLSPDRVMPENFTYSTLGQRYQAFNRGFVSGELEQCLSPDSASAKS